MGLPRIEGDRCIVRPSYEHCIGEFVKSLRGITFSLSVDGKVSKTNEGCFLILIKRVGNIKVLRFYIIQKKVNDWNKGIVLRFRDYLSVSSLGCYASFFVDSIDRHLYMFMKSYFVNEIN